MIKTKYYLTPDEIKLFSKVLKRKGKDRCWFLIFTIGLLTGARISEILNIQYLNLSQEREYGVLELQKTKNNKLRIAYLPVKFTSSLLNYRCKGNKSNYILPHFRTSVNRIFKSISEEIKINYISPHTLRRTFALTLIKKKYPLNHLQYLLGHSNLQTTSLYLKVKIPENPLNFLLDF